MKLRVALILVLALSSAVSAVSLQDWLKKNGKYQKRRRPASNQTMVAAVRGVEEPGDVDPEARDFNALEKMENRNVSQSRLSKFISDGKLKRK